MRILKGTEALLRDLSIACFRRPVLTLSIAAVVTLLSLGAASRIKIDTDMVALLPKTAPSVLGLELVRERIGAIGSVGLYAESEDQQALDKFIATFVERAEALSSIAYVQQERTASFFRERGLFYLNLDELEDLLEQVEDVVTWHKTRANPLFVDLEDSEPPKLDVEALRARYGFRGATLEPPPSSDETPAAALFIRPSGRASNLSFTKKVVADLEALVLALNPEATGVRVELGGRYIKRRAAQTTIERDLRITSIIAIGLLLLYAALHFRSLWAIPLLLVPLVMGTVWTLALAALVLGTLNILVAFVGTILLGLGIDHGIHLLSRYLEERETGEPHPEAVHTAFADTGRGVFLAGCTTALGFLGLALSEFRGFQEFGMIASLGVAILVVAYLTCLPALLALIGPSLRIRAGGAEPGGLLAGLARLTVPGPLGRVTFIVATIALVLLSVAGAGHSFDYDFQSLEGGDPAMRALEDKLNRVAGRGHAPVIAFAKDATEARAAAEALRTGSGDDSPIDVVIAADEMVPELQDKKHKVITALRSQLERIPQGAATTDEDRVHFQTLRRMTEAEPFTRQMLPVEVQQQFSDPRAVVIFPRERLSDGRKCRRFADAVREIPVPGGATLSAHGEAMVLADVVRMTFQEAPFVAAVTLALVFATILLLMMSLKAAVICLLLAVFTVSAGMGLARFLGIPLNYMNVVVIPALFGMSVDAGVHLVARSALPSQHLARDLAQTGGAVLGATVTTAFGFGALLAAHHQGLNSMGAIALLGLSASLFAALIWLMSMFAWRAAPRTESQPSSKDANEPQ